MLFRSKDRVGVTPVSDGEVEILRAAEAREAVRLKERVKCESLQELIDFVSNAERIISAENGVANLAGALGKPLTVICGPTEPTHILGQYKRYLPEWDYTMIQGKQPTGCQLPCWRREDRGMFAPPGADSELCCGYSATALCLQELDVSLVTKEAYATT